MFSKINNIHNIKKTYAFDALSFVLLLLPVKIQYGCVISSFSVIVGCVVKDFYTLYLKF